MPSATLNVSKVLHVFPSYSLRGAWCPHSTDGENKAQDQVQVGIIGLNLQGKKTLNVETYSSG